VKPDRRHWASQPELARSYWQFKALIAMVRLLPLGVLICCAFPISFFYYFLAKRARRESRRFLDAVNAQLPEGKRRSVYRHFASFAICLVEKAAAWGGRINGGMIRYQDDAIGSLVEDINGQKGAFLLCSHLGNAEMLRALADFGRTRAGRAFPVVSIVDYSMAEQFGRMLREINPGSMDHLISARNIGVETMGRLEECLDRGGLVVSAGDRTAPDGGRNRRFLIEFLGRPAPFPVGSFYLASLLKRNVYFVFALRRKTFSLACEYDFHVIKSGVDFNCPRREREARMERLARSYAETLEQLCKVYPYQWYNYYDFWEAPDG
jgi:predicted LPLAT superfamily acyltransferase